LGKPYRVVLPSRTELEFLATSDQEPWLPDLAVQSKWVTLEDRRIGTERSSEGTGRGKEEGERGS